MHLKCECKEEVVGGEEHETKLSQLRKALIDGEESEMATYSLRALNCNLDKDGGEQCK